MFAAAVAIPVVAIAWLLISGISGAPPPSAGSRPSTPAVADVNAGIVNINGVVPDGLIAGTGMVLTSDGLVLTNNHVVANTTSLTAQLAGQGPVYQATVLGVDPTQDVAVIKLQGASGLPTVSFDLSGSLVVGDHVTGLGNALGRDGAPVPASGSVTSLDETIQVQDESATIRETLDGVICFDAPIQPGDSGGPLLNDQGHVIGMDTAGSRDHGKRCRCPVGVRDPHHPRHEHRAADTGGHCISLYRVRSSRNPRSQRRREVERHRRGC